MVNLVLAVIYCRVSSVKQLTEGDGLKSQERSCRAYAALKGYAVLNVFTDGITGGTVSRSGMNDLLRFLENAQREGGKEVVVLIDDIKRFARDVEGHFDLKNEVVKRGGRLDSPLFRFENTPEGKFVETVFAAQAELERSQNARQTRNRMKARLEGGFWPFARTPPGYCFRKHPVHKKVLALDDRAPIVKEALVGFASNRFGSVAEVYRFLRDAGFFLGSSSGRMKTHYNEVRAMLKHPLYTGYVAYAPWGVSRRKGHHPALISLAEFDRMQQKLAGNSQPALRADTRADFPLRNIVVCADCGRRLTASWSRGRTCCYAYYHCYARECPSYGKVIPKHILEEAHGHLLLRHESTDEVVEYARRLAREEWQKKQSQQANAEAHRKRRANELDAEIERLAERIAGTANEAVYKALEARVDRITSERCRLGEIPARAEEYCPDFGTQFDKVRAILKSPYQSYQAGDLWMKRTISRMVFPEPLVYDKKSGFGTAQSSLPYHVLREVASRKSVLVGTDEKTSNSLAFGPGKPLVSSVWTEFLEVIGQWSATLTGAQGSPQPPMSSGPTEL